MNMETNIEKINRVILIVLTGFLALSAILGGIGLLTKLIAMPVEMLQGSIFSDFTIPGVALSVIVGGSALLATIMLIRKSRYGSLLSALAALIIMFFEFVEVLVIGSPVGLARDLQIFYFGLGTIIMVTALGAWYLTLTRKDK
jgi:hypothetical protein